MRRFIVGVLCVVWGWGLNACGEENIARLQYSGQPHFGGPNGSGDDSVTEVPQTPYASNVSISEIAAYQTVKVTLMEGREDVTNREAPIIAGKDLLVRVFVELGQGWKSREVVAALSLESSSESFATQSAKKYVTVSSSDANLESTFNFNIDGELLKGDLRYSIALFEASSTVESDGDLNGAQWPGGGKAMFQESKSNHDLEIVLVPIRYNADGSGRLPDVGSAQIERYRSALSAMYPAAAVNIRVHEPVDWSQEVAAFGQGWGQLLSALQGLRNQNGASSREYYYGVFSPASSYQSYCNQGCVGGLSSLAQDHRYANARVSIGLGYSGDETAATMVHEIGHAHGREHAPCGLMGQSSDSNYPNSTAKLDAWGYDARNQTLKRPSSYVDMMSYCDPIWISSYTYNALFDRIVAVNSLASFQEPKNSEDANAQWLVLVAEPDGTWNFGTPLTLNEYPRGIEREVTLRNVHGKFIRTERAEFFPYSHGEGGLMLIRQPNFDVKFLEFEGNTLKL